MSKAQYEYLAPATQLIIDVIDGTRRHLLAGGTVRQRPSPLRVFTPEELAELSMPGSGPSLISAQALQAAKRQEPSRRRLPARCALVLAAPVANFRLIYRPALPPSRRSPRPRQPSSSCSGRYACAPRRPSTTRTLTMSRRCAPPARVADELFASWLTCTSLSWRARPGRRRRRTAPRC